MSFPIAYRLKSKFLTGAKRKSPSRSGTKLFSHPCIYLVLQLQTSTFLESSLLCTSLYVTAQFPLSGLSFPFLHQRTPSFQESALMPPTLPTQSAPLSCVPKFFYISAIVLICAVAFTCVFPLLAPECPSSRNPVFFVFQHLDICRINSSIFPSFAFC